MTEGRSPHRTLAPDTVGPEGRKPTSLRGIADKAKADQRHRFRDLYRWLNVELLLDCWDDLNKDAASGVDGVTWQRSADNLQTNVEAVVERLKQKRYRAKLIRRHYLPKGNGHERPLGILVIEDKLLQAACARILNAIYEQELLGCSYGYRPGRGAGEAVRDLTFDLQYGRYGYVVEADIRGFFDSLPHDGVVAAVARRISDPWILRLIRRWLRAGVLEEGQVRTAVAGSPQGGVISPLLSNAYLHTFDAEWETKARGAKLIRYCDDDVILCRGNPQPWFQRMERIMTGLGLTLNAEKPRIVDAAEGFDFLGMHFRLKPMRSNPQRLFCYRWPSTKAMQSIRHKIRDAIGHDDLDSLQEKIRAINLILRGWGQYFRISNAHRHFKKLDSYVHTKLVNFLRRKHQRRGRGFRDCPASFLKKAGLSQLHGTIERVPRMTPGEHSRKAG